MKINDNVKIPDFFILGAPKAGTTALSEYLRNHPDIFFSYPKETNFFNDDFSDKFRRVHTQDKYLNQCFYNSKGYKAVGEGTVYYLFSKTAVDNILKFNPNSKFIVMLRNPVDISYSLHSTTYLAGDENISDFKKAWSLQKDRANNLHIPKTCREPEILQYGEIAMLGKQIKRLFEKVDKKNILIIFFEDFKTDTLKTYKEVLSFLNVKYDGKTDFPIINENKTPRSRFVIQIIEKLSRIDIAMIKRKLGIKPGVSILGFLGKLNYKSKKREKLEDKFVSELKSFFKDDIILLEKLTGRDLSSWYK